MQVEAIYEQGQLTFVHPLPLAQDTFRVLVDIPDEVLDKKASQATRQAAKKNHGIRAEIDAILGTDVSTSPVSQDYKSVWHRHLEEKYLDK